MKKYLVLLFIILLVGCNKKEVVEDTEVISFKGRLVCGYKENRVNENVIYSSYYIFNFNDNGILEGASNKESVELNGALDSIKDKYKKALDESIKDYDDIKGIKVTKSIEDNIYSFTVDMDNTKMDDDIKKDYLLDYDRISLYKLFTNNKYTCE